MTLSQVRVFLMVASSGSFTSAARELGMVPALGVGAHQAHGDGVRRGSLPPGSRGLRLSAAGEALMPHAQQAVESADAADRALRDVTSLRGGVATSAYSATRITTTCRGFSNASTRSNPTCACA